MSFLASGFIVFIVKERVTKAKHLQYLSGINVIPFWASAFAWDMISFLIPVALILLLFRAFDVVQLVGDRSWGHMLLLFVVYACSVLPQCYCASFIFNESTGAFVKMVIFHIVTGVGPLIVSTILLLIGKDSIQNVVDKVFMFLFPNYCLSQAVDLYYMNRYLSVTCEQVGLRPGNQRCEDFFSNGVKAADWCCKPGGYNPNFISWYQPGIGKELFFLALQSVGYTIVLLLIEYGVFRKLGYWMNAFNPRERNHYQISQGADDLELTLQRLGDRMDDDVKEERKKVQQLASGYQVGDLHPLLVNKLTKVYSRGRSSVLAVDHLSFKVLKTDCFGLLGQNGAGKTSTFEMLTGANHVSNGDAEVVGLSIRSDWKKAGREVGYCPQFDALIELLTGREALTMYARLRGIPEHLLAGIVNNLVGALGLTDFSNRYIQNYSGGMKRKLSLGVALIGEPPLLLLDEPTNGVDPKTRRFVWKILTQIRERGIAMLLSSHSMEECEALCTRIALMASGRLKCIGSPQHLKTKFGNSYTVVIKVKDEAYIPTIMRHFVSVFSNSSVPEIQKSTPPTLHYRLPVANTSWSMLFTNVQKLSEKPELGILEYNISQATLEQVFLNLTTNATSSDEENENGQLDSDSIRSAASDC